MATQSALQYCLTITHSCTHSHTDDGNGPPCKVTAVRVRCLAQWHLNTQEEPRIEPATLQLPADPLNHLSYCRSAQWWNETARERGEGEKAQVLCVRVTCSGWRCGSWHGGVCISAGSYLCLHLCWRSSSEPRERLHQKSCSGAEEKVEVRWIQSGVAWDVNV